ncbi:tetratricopeptide repeat protein [Acinetobacter bereziniae]|uniref:tetratricopeptide repeat protein n=1 Tax=Acinetobacter bereziniae TaxID=106648 RepID=UPI00124F1E6B|nr:tetratricopeptide repeat protein [Acinetobacter bereziniae]
MKILMILSIFLIFSVCTNSASYEKSYELELAKAGNIDAQYNVAMNYLNGIDGFPKDEKVAKEWLEKAAKKGDAPSQNGLGIIYLTGIGGEKNLNKSEYYYRLAANQNHENAQLQLALILLKDTGKDKHINEAVIWLKKSGMQGNIEAQQKLKELGVKM